MYDIFKPRFLQSCLPPRILIGVGGSTTTSVDTVAREAAAAAQESVDAITAQIGEVIAPNQGVISSDGIQYENRTGSDITLSGTSSVDLLSDGLTVVAGNLVAGSVSTSALADAAVTNEKLADMASLTVKGNNGGAAGAPADLTTSDLVDMLPLATSSTNGLMSAGDKVKAALVEFRFNALSQMVAEPSLAIGDRVRVRGYYQDDDGGANVYEIVAAGTGTADGGSLIELTGSGLQAKALFPEGPRLEHWGTAKDGVTDDAAKIVAAVDWCFANGVRTLQSSETDGNYAISGNVQLKENVHLDFGYNTMVPLSNDAGFTMARNGAIENLNWDASGLPTWQGPMILIDSSTDSSIIAYPRIRNVTCSAYDDTVNAFVNGVMISLDATAGTRVSGVRASGLNASNLECVVEFKASDLALNGWVNSNHLEFDIIYNCTQCITMNRSASDNAISNNYIKATFQPGPTDNAPVLYCDGRRNEFDLLIWDWDPSVLGTAIEFGPISEQNLVRGSYDPLGVKDSSVALKRNEIEARGTTNAPFSKYAHEPASINSGLFMGQVDNCLAFADLRYSISAPSVSTGNLATIFTPNQSAQPTWQNITSLTIEVDLLAVHGAIRTFGVVFGDGFVPDAVVFESSLDGVSWTEIKSMPGSRVTCWSGRGFIGGTFQYLRVTITTAAATNFIVTQMFAWWKNQVQGGYLPTGGGDLYGNTTVNGGKSVLFSSTTGSGAAGVSVDNGNRLTIDATGGVKLNGTRILGDQQPAVTDPTGGTVVDVECRAALIALADRIRNHGLIAI